MAGGGSWAKRRQTTMMPHVSLAPAHPGNANVHFCTTKNSYTDRLQNHETSTKIVPLVVRSLYHFGAKRLHEACSYSTDRLQRTKAWVAAKYGPDLSFIFRLGRGTFLFDF